MANEFQTEKKSKLEDDLWYLDNYILLRDYYDRTVSRIAARCVRNGNIAIEDYPFYGYILDVLEEINDVGDYVLSHKELYPYIEKKIAGGVNALKKNLREYKEELRQNSTPDMIKSDTNKEVEKMKQALGGLDEKTGFNPTAGAGMGIDELMSKLMASNNIDDAAYQKHDNNLEAKPELKKVVKIKKPSGIPEGQAVPQKNNIEG